MTFQKLLFALVLCASTFVQGQLTIMTHNREDGIYDAKNSQWEITDNRAEMSVFTFNEALTAFRHITESISSKYTILENEFDEEEYTYTMVVESDAGNLYDMIIDGVNELVIFFYYDEDENFHMVRYIISDTAFDEF